MKPKHNRALVDDNWDGIKIEEHKMMKNRLKTPKSRWSWKGECVKYDCLNRDIECSNCFKFDMYEKGE